MKSKRRHELQTNELADRLGHWIEQVRPHLATAGLVAAAVVAVIAAGFYWASSKEQFTAQAWRQYMFASYNQETDMIETLNSVAEKFGDTTAGLWAAQTAADLEAGQGVQLLFENKEKAQDLLQNAIVDYEKVLANKLTQKTPMLLRRAQFGIAGALEATGELEEAKKHYQAVIDIAPDSAVAAAAKRRLDKLAQESTQQWYAWFARQKPIKRPASDLSPTDDLGSPATDLGILPEGPTSDFMKEDDSTSAEPADTSVEGEDKSDAPSADAAASKKTPAKVAAPAAKDEPAQKTESAAPSDGPSLDGPTVEPPKTEGAKEPAASPDKKEAAKQ